MNQFLAMWTFLLCKRPLLSMRVFWAVPSLMLIEAGAVELALAVSTDAAHLKLGLRGSRPTRLTSARRFPMMATALHFLST